MAKKLTKKRIRRFLRNPNRCPVCRSRDLSTLPGSYDASAGDASIMTAKVECEECSATWTELYRLFTIEDLWTPEKPPDNKESKLEGPAES